jgi:hypothetical protein
MEGGDRREAMRRELHDAPLYQGTWTPQGPAYGAMYDCACADAASAADCAGRSVGRPDGIIVLPPHP